MTARELADVVIGAPPVDFAGFDPHRRVGEHGAVKHGRNRGGRIDHRVGSSAGGLDGRREGLGNSGRLRPGMGPGAHSDYHQAYPQKTPGSGRRGRTSGFGVRKWAV